MPGALVLHWSLVAVVTLIVAAAAVGYTFHQPREYVARATLAVVPPAQTQALGAATNETPEQYRDAQLVLLQSPDVAARAANIGNTSLHANVFTPDDFNGPHSSLKVAIQSSTVVPDNNSSVVEVTFNSHNAAQAAAGANALVAAYQSALAASLQATYSSIVSAIDATLQQVNEELAAPGQNQALVAQRADLLQRRTVALIDEKVAGSQSQSAITAFTPTKASNHQVIRNSLLGAVVGFLLGSVGAYAIEARRRRSVAGASNGKVELGGTPASQASQGWDRWDMGGSDGTTSSQRSFAVAQSDVDSEIGEALLDEALQTEPPR